MIDNKELRVGNWVYLGDKTLFPMFIVSVSGDKDVTLDFKVNEGMPWEANADYLVGIPLTVELLTDAGFSSNGWFYWYNGFPFTLTPSESGWHLCYECRSIIDKPIKFVHELQNVFYALMKEELKFNL